MCKIETNGGSKYNLPILARKYILDPSIREHLLRAVNIALVVKLGLYIREANV